MLSFGQKPLALKALKKILLQLTSNFYNALVRANENTSWLSQNTVNFFIQEIKHFLITMINLFGNNCSVYMQFYQLLKVKENLYINAIDVLVCFYTMNSILAEQSLLLGVDSISQGSSLKEQNLKNE